MPILLLFVLISLLCSYLLDTVLDLLKFQSAKKKTPEEFSTIYSPKESQKMILYLKKNLLLSFFERTIFFFSILFFLIFKGFLWLSILFEKWNSFIVFKSVAICATLFLALFLLKIPFNAYRTFFIEKKFDLSAITVKTFMKDILKSILLAFFLGIPMLITILWLMTVFTNYAWLIIFFVLTFWQIFIVFIAPIVILPLFNTFRPLEESSLKKEIKDFCKKTRFSLKEVFIADGSQRSNKGNAFFTGFGKFKKIVLFDTLLSKMDTKEIMSILAHEIGHFKKKHILKKQLFSFMESFLMLLTFHIFLKSNIFFDSFFILEQPLSVAIPIFLLIFQPFFSIFDLISLYFSRKYEYEADRYSIETYPKKNILGNALKKLLHNHLSPLVHHPLCIFFQHSHPPVIQRIEKIRQYACQ